MWGLTSDFPTNIFIHVLSAYYMLCPSNYFSSCHLTKVIVVQIFQPSVLPSLFIVNIIFSQAPFF